MFVEMGVVEANEVFEYDAAVRSFEGHGDVLEHECASARAGGRAARRTRRSRLQGPRRQLSA